MSRTDHYTDLTLEQIQKAMPQATLIKEGQDTYKLRWNEPGETNLFGVDLTVKRGFNGAEEWVHVDKGCVDCRNGQNQFSDYVKEALGLESVYTD